MTNLQNAPNLPHHTHPKDTTEVVLDRLDTQLIQLLEQDGRMSYADLGTAVGLTPGGARARVMRLQEKGIIRFVGLIEPSSVGLNSAAALSIEVNGDIDAVADRISQLEGVRYLVLGSGRYSILVEAYARTPAELFTLINRRMREVPGVLSIESFIYDSVHTPREPLPISHIA